MGTNVKVYFCDPQGPWQRGTNEKVIHPCKAGELPSQIITHARSASQLASRSQRFARLRDGLARNSVSTAWRSVVEACVLFTFTWTPNLFASATSWLLSCIVRKSIGTSCKILRISFAASTPSRTGVAISRITRSGFRALFLSLLCRCGFTAYFNIKPRTQDGAHALTHRFMTSAISSRKVLFSTRRFTR
jgi:hypothetical protein